MLLEYMLIHFFIAPCEGCDMRLALFERLAITLTLLAEKTMAKLTI